MSRSAWCRPVVEAAVSAGLSPISASPRSRLSRQCFPVFTAGTVRLAALTAGAGSAAAGCEILHPRPCAGVDAGSVGFASVGSNRTDDAGTAALGLLRLGLTTDACLSARHEAGAGRHGHCTGGTDGTGTGRNQARQCVVNLQLTAL